MVAATLEYLFERADRRIRFFQVALQVRTELHVDDARIAQQVVEAIDADFDDLGTGATHGGRCIPNDFRYLAIRRGVDQVVSEQSEASTFQ